MTVLRTYAEVKKFKPTKVEQALIDACKVGEPCVLGSDVPSEPSAERTIRADILRYLILGGCEKCPVDGRGVDLSGGYITGMLHLNFGTAKGATVLTHCYFDSQFDAIQTRFEMLILSDSTLKGFSAQGAEIKGSVFLRSMTASATVALNSATIGGQLDCDCAQLNATAGQALNAQRAEIKGGVFLRSITASSTVALNGATIGGQLDCDDAQLNATEGSALNAQGAEIKGDVFLSSITASATVALNGATIGGQLDCEGAQLHATEGDALNAQRAQIKDSVFLRSITASATVDLNGATIGGQLDCNGAQLNATEGDALNAQSLNIHDILIWRTVTTKGGIITFNSAHTNVLADDAGSWPGGNRLDLDGFTYNRIVASSMNVKTRIAWLKKGCYWYGTFHPQPFTQLAKVLSASGHDGDAQKVLTRREHLRYRHFRNDLRVRPNGDVSVAFKSLWRDLCILILWGGHLVLRAVAGYGHRPFRSIGAMLILVGATAVPAHLAWQEGSFAPNAAVIQTSPDWIKHLSAPNPAVTWSKDDAPGQDWETFNSIAYAVDVVIPIINFSQTEAWAPSTTRGPWGWHLWWGRWLSTTLGWIFTALGAAAITGIIRRE